MPPTAAKTRVSEGRSRYQALTHLSVPQRTETGTLTGQNELVDPGEIVELTEREAANLMATGPRAGRMTPAIRPYSQHGDPLPKLTARHLSGQLRTPATPPPGSDAPRPDPPGSSQVRVIEAELPEMTEPVPGSETVTDAIDLPPRAARTAAT
jgi:hypothetical protein